MHERDPNDPKELILEAFRIEGITLGECRSIFVDWALGVSVEDHVPLIEALLKRHESDPDDHPMKAVLTEGLAPRPAKGRRGGRSGRAGR